MLEVIYAKESHALPTSHSIFLVGPTPRNELGFPWRQHMIEALDLAGFEGIVFSPEPRGGKWQAGYDEQVEWEHAHLEMCDLILAWVPRCLPHMPAFTTNVEFGLYVDSGKFIYGRPQYAEKIRYLDWVYRKFGLGEPYDDMPSIARAAVAWLNEFEPKNQTS